MSNNSNKRPEEINLTRRKLLLGGLAAVVASGAAIKSPWIVEYFSRDGVNQEHKKLSDISMQSSWINDAEFIGYFIGMQKGYYENLGINLDYMSGGPQIVADMVVASGKADLALTTPDTTLNAIINQNLPFKIIGAQYQKNPLGIVSLKNNNINKPSDLIGKSLAVPSANMVTIEAFLKINKISTSDINIVPYQYDPTPLIKGEVDATLDFVTNVPYTIRLQGEEPSSFLLHDYGFKIFNNTVVVLEETLKTKRQELVGWLKASRNGWEENFKNPEQYPNIFIDTYFQGTGRTLENEIFFNKAQESLMKASGGFFSMSEEKIAENIESLNQVGLKATRDMFVTDLLNEAKSTL